MGQIKKIELIIKDSCYGCPFLQYDPDYGMSYDSGYDCGHDDGPIKRIINDGELKRNSFKFPSIPEGCPLENATEEEYEKYLNED